MSESMTKLVMTLFICCASVGAVVGVAIGAVAAAEHGQDSNTIEYRTCIASPNHSLVSGDCLLVIATPAPVSSKATVHK